MQNSVSFIKFDLPKAKAFTLVELIVVIVILSILATIAFLSFNNQSSTARDSIRLSDISSISKWLNALVVNSWAYPFPSKYVIIKNSIWAISRYQWEAWDSVLNLLKSSANWFKDPLDNTFYTYSINWWRNKYQLMTYLENQTNLWIDFNDLLYSYSTSSVNRFLFVKWDNLWIISIETPSSLSPLQDYIYTWSNSNASIIQTITSTWIVAISWATIIDSNSISSTSSWKLFITSTWIIDNIFANSEVLIGQISAYNPSKIYSVWEAFIYSWSKITVKWSNYWEADTKYPWCTNNDIMVWSWSKTNIWASCDLVWNLPDSWINAAVAQVALNNTPWCGWKDCGWLHMWWMNNGSYAAPYWCNWVFNNMDVSCWSDSNKQWICKSWYHIPTSTEMNNSAMSFWTLSSFENVLWLSTKNCRNISWWYTYWGQYWLSSYTYIWVSWWTTYNRNFVENYILWYWVWWWAWHNNWLFVRCIKN